MAGNRVTTQVAEKEIKTIETNKTDKKTDYITITKMNNEQEFVHF